MKIFYIAIMIILGSCTSSEDLLNSLKLEEGEIGAVCVRGSIDINPNPFVTTSVAFVYREYSEGELPIDC